jgi:intein-encoded DNA endonuclease-like protein
MPIFKYIDKNFFKTWNSEMSYILGFMYADGNIMQNKRGAYFFAIYSSDKELLLQMLKYMKSEHKLSKRKGLDKPSYSFQIGSKEMCSDLINLGLTPNKSKRMNLPIVPKKYFSDFIRGYFDGDGSVWSGLVHKDRKISTHTISVTFTSASADYLKSIHKELKLLNVKGGAIYVDKRGNYARLVFSTLDSLKLYEIMYNVGDKLVLNRKKLVFENFLKLRV